MAYRYSIGVLGAGAWGTALAEHLATPCGHRVLVWSYEKSAAKAINKKHQNPDFTGGAKLSENISATTDPEEVMGECEMVIFASPSANCQEMAMALAPKLDDDQILIISAKGFRDGDGALLSDVWMEANPKFKNIVILSGPAFSQELIEQKPVTATLAADSHEVIKRVDRVFNSSLLRLYYGDDIIGTQVGGAIKNTVAIAAGVSDGLEMGEGFKAALLCRGVVEMMRYSHHLGGKRLTLAGLSGVGDLLMTAGEGSRNYRFGYLLGQGMSIEDAKQEIDATIEGIGTAGIVTMQGVSRGIDMGVIMAVHGIVNGDLDPKRTFDLLLERPRVYEFDKNDTLGG